MKKIFYLIISIIFLNFLSACAGYKPIYKTNLKFEITDYSITANKKLGRQIYSKLDNLSKSHKNNKEIRSITLAIAATKNKDVTVRDSAGKALEYRIILTSKIIIKDYLTDNEMLNHTFTYSSSYKVQDQYSETKKLESKSIENLLDKTYQNLLIKMSENI